jgi:acyl carrier protein
MDARDLIAQVVRKKTVTCPDDTLLVDIEGLDSFKVVHLMLQLEELVGRELSEDDIEELQSVSDVERLLQSHALNLMAGKDDSWVVVSGAGGAFGSPLAAH